MNFVICFFFANVLIGISCAASLSSSELPQNNSCSVEECINSGYGDLSTMILCSGCMEKVLANQNTAIKFHKIQQQMIDSDKIHPTKFEDLNADVLWLIFDHITIKDLMNFLEAYPPQSVALIVKEYFWKKYKHFEVNMNERNGPDGAQINLKSKVIGVGKKSPTFLRHFGGVVCNLKIMWPSPLLMQSINKYCANSLVALKMDLYKQEPFDHFNNVFSELEYLKLQSTEIKHNLAVNHLFPKLTKLYLDSCSLNGEWYSTCTFPKMVHLKLSVGYTSNGHCLYELLLKNPQVKKIDMDNLYQHHCNTINGFAPNLEYISTTFVKIDHDSTFEHVKYFKMGRYGGNVHNLFFPRLDSLEFTYSKWNPVRWNEFISNHTNVTNLIIHEMEDQDIVIELMNRLPNLIEIALDCHRENSSIHETVRHVLNFCAKVEKMTIISCYTEEEQISELRDNIGDNWNIVVEHEEGSSEIAALVFEKLN